MFQKIELRKTRDFTAKINVTFDFIRQNFVVLAKALMYISGPFILLEGLFMGLYQRKALSLGQESGGIFGVVMELIEWFGAAMIFLLFAYISTLIVINEFVRLYEIREDPRTIEISELWDAVKANFFKMFFAGIAVTALTAFATLLLVIPGIYVAITLSLAAPVLIIEKKGIGESISRCFSLITDKWWSTFGLVFVCSLLVSFMGFVFQFPSTMFNLLVVYHKTTDALVELPLWEQIGIIATSVVATIGSNLLQSIVLIALIFQFYNLVERKEAQGLMNKLESFGKSDANTPQNDETY